MYPIAPQEKKLTPKPLRDVWLSVYKIKSIEKTKKRPYKGKKVKMMIVDWMLRIRIRIYRGM